MLINCGEGIRNNVLFISLISEGSIEAPAAKIYTMEDHIISCVITDITAKQSDIVWSPIPAGSVADAYTQDLGSYDSSGNTQTAFLKIKSSELALLKSFQARYLFTCTVTVGDSVSKSTQDLLLFTPSNPTNI